MMSNLTILNGNFFSILEEKDGHIKAQCCFCPSKINGTPNSTSNFLKHIKVNKTYKYFKFQNMQ